MPISKIVSVHVVKLEFALSCTCEVSVLGELDIRCLIGCIVGDQVIIAQRIDYVLTDFNIVRIADFDLVTVVE